MERDKEEVFQTALDKLGHENPFVRELAAEAFGSLKDVRAVTPLINVLNKEKDEKVLKAAVTALGKIGDSRALRPLVRMLRSEFPPTVRKAAADAFGDIGDQRVIKVLEVALDKERDHKVKAALEYAIKSIEEQKELGAGHKGAVRRMQRIPASKRKTKKDLPKVTQ